MEMAFFHILMHILMHITSQVNHFQSSWGTRQGGHQGDVIGGRSWFSSHKLDSPLPPRCAFCASPPLAMGPGKRAMTQQHLLTRSGYCARSRFFRGPSQKAPWKSGMGILGNQVFNAQSPND